MTIAVSVFDFCPEFAGRGKGVRAVLRSIYSEIRGKITWVQGRDLHGFVIILLQTFEISLRLALLFLF